jgi:heterotetrameric sarcosine oxidase delta subunit
VTPLACPFCGPRELREFVFHKTLPPATSATEFESTYLRVADPQSSIEHWQHAAGCRAWLRVQRNPSTGEVLAVQMLDGAER